MSIIPFIVQVTRNHDAQKQGDGLVWQRHRDISLGLCDTAMHFLCAIPSPLRTVAMSIIPFIVHVTRNHDAQRQGDGLV